MLGIKYKKVLLVGCLTIVTMIFMGCAKNYDIEDKDMLFDVVYDMWEDNAFPNTVYVYGADKAEDILLLDEEMEDSLGKYLKKMDKKDGYISASIMDVMDVYFDNKKLLCWSVFPSMMNCLKRK